MKKNKFRLIPESIRQRRWSQASLIFHMKLNQKFRRRGQTIFIACAPKSGSTFLARCLARVTGFEIRHMTYAWCRSEEELYLPKMLDVYTSNTVVQQPLRGNEANIDLMNRFKIRPVVLVRNIFDTVVSIRDHLLREGVERFPALYATEAFTHLEEEEQFDFIIANAMPWYFNFYASWWDACQSKRIEALWLTYDDLIVDWSTGLTKVLDFYGIERSIGEVQEAVETLEGAAATRFNVGRIGRGKAQLTSSQQMAISGFAKFYPWVDLSSVGLGTRLAKTIEKGTNGECVS